MLAQQQPDSPALTRLLQHESASIVLDATALPQAMQHSTLTDEDWRLMLISLNWVHQRFTQHPENGLGFKWFCRSPESLAMLLRLHPPLVKDMQEQWPTLNEVLTVSPVKKGVWKSLTALKASPEKKANFFQFHQLYPLQRWMQHQGALLEVLRIESRHRPRTLVHSIGLPVDENHAHAVDVITIPDLSLLMHASMQYEDESSPSAVLSTTVKSLIQQLSTLMHHHHVVVWDSYTASLLMKFVPDFPLSQLHVTHPCWLMELPSQLSQYEREASPHLLDHAFHVWCFQHGWVDVPAPPLHVKDSGLKPDVMTPPEFLIVSLRDSLNEDFMATLTLAYTLMIDALALLPAHDGTDTDEAYYVEDERAESHGVDGSKPTVEEVFTHPESRLAQALIEENGEALVNQGKRHLVCLYTPGQYSKAEAALKAHPLTPLMNERIRLVPATPLNKALLYPKAMAYGVIPLGRTFYPTLLEAMAYTLPVIAPRHVCFDTLVQEGGVLYNPNDVTTLPGTVQKLTQRDAGKANRTRYMARKAAETRSWQRFGGELFKAYHTIFMDEPQL